MPFDSNAYWPSLALTTACCNFRASCLVLQETPKYVVANFSWTLFGDVTITLKVTPIIVFKITSAFLLSVQKPKNDTWSIIQYIPKNSELKKGNLISIPEGSFFNERADIQLRWEFLHIQDFESRHGSIIWYFTLRPAFICSHTPDWSRKQQLQSTNISVEIQFLAWSLQIKKMGK